MTREWGTHGGRDDVYLAGDLPDLGRFRIDELPLLEADELSGRGEFPHHGDYALATELETGREVYVQVTEGLEDAVDELRGEEPVTQVGIDVSGAEKSGEDATSPWRYVLEVAPLGPPDAEGP